MSEGEPSFEVRERRRFKKEAAGSETTAAEPHDADAVDSDVAASSTVDEADATGAAASSDMGEPIAAEPSGQDTPDSGSIMDDFGDEEELLPGGEGAMPDITTAGFIQFMLANLYQLGWQNLGLVPNPATGKMEANLPDAQLAIDAYGALLSVMSPRLEEGPRREMQMVLTNLRINFMEQSKRKGETQ